MSEIRARHRPEKKGVGGRKHLPVIPAIPITRPSPGAVEDLLLEERIAPVLGEIALGRCRALDIEVGPVAVVETVAAVLGLAGLEGAFDVLAEATGPVSSSPRLVSPFLPAAVAPSLGEVAALAHGRGRGERRGEANSEELGELHGVIDWRVVSGRRRFLCCIVCIG